MSRAQFSDVKSLFHRAHSVAVIGFGKTGRAVLSFLLQNTPEKEIFLYNDGLISEDQEKADFQKRGVDFIEGGPLFSKLKKMDFIIISPGVDGRNSRFDEIRNSGIPIVSEIELASYFIISKIIAVTGTNGKSTTVSLIHHLLKRCGLSSILAGNIGNPLIAEVSSLPESSIVVLEVSSFQLEEIFHFRPHIAVILNITPDHLDRYADFEGYVEAKLEIYRNQKSTDYVVLNADDDCLRKNVHTNGNVIRFSTRQLLDSGYFIKDGFACKRIGAQEEKISLKNNPLRGIHNLENLLSSIIVARLMGVGIRDIEDALGSFKGLTHRIESLGKIGNVEYINDSKATNVDAALKSLVSFSFPMVLILGGKDKGGDFKILEDAIKEKASRVLLIGKAADLIHNQLIRVKERLAFVKDLKEAVRKGYEILKDTGGVVLLAPGCASFDMFENFEHRGEIFRKEFSQFKKKMENG